MVSLQGWLAPFEADANGFATITGWAFDAENENGVIEVEITADDQIFASLRANKLLAKDKSRLFPAKSFRAVVPPNFSSGREVEFVARAYSAGSSIELGRRTFRGGPSFGHIIVESPIETPLNSRALHQTADNRSIAAIVLTQDNQQILEGLLESICLHEQNTFSRVVIVDHGSSEGIGRVVNRFQSKLRLSVLAAPKEGSFANSNNNAAKLCSEDILVFINDDIIFMAPVVSQLAAHIGPGVGVAGLKLIDPSFDYTELAAQHVGIHFWPAKDLFPFESRWLTDQPSANYISLDVPAVTAAFSAVENQLFKSLGGFDERYFYGWEDVDLCMKALAAGRSNISVNSISAVHLRGQTRSRMWKSQAVQRQRNPAVFAKEWEFSLQRAFIRDQFERVGYWTGRKLHFGILGETDDPRDLAQASSLATAIATLLPSRVFAGGFNNDFRDLDVLILISPPPEDAQFRGVSNLAWIVFWKDGASYPTAYLKAEGFDIRQASTPPAHLSPSQLAEGVVAELKLRALVGLPNPPIRL